MDVATLPGRPDICFLRSRVAIFVHGCFWHQCPTCKRNLIPKANAEFWQLKFARNKERDQLVQARLVSMGYSVLVLWECEVSRNLQAAIDQVAGVVSRVAESTR